LTHTQPTARQRQQFEALMQEMGLPKSNEPSNPYCGLAREELRMNYYILDPEVPGGMGSDTVIQPSSDNSFLWHVDSLHIEIAGWMGDDLLQNHPCHMVTDRLKKALEVSDLSGFEIAKMKVTVDEQSLMFRDSLFTSWPLPPIHWLKITGIAGIDDFGLTAPTAPIDFVVSARAMNLLRSFQLESCEISEYETALGDTTAQNAPVAYYAVQPEKAGHVISTPSSAAPGNGCLQIEMTTYLGGGLIQVDKEFIVTGAVRGKLEQADCTGCKFGCVEASIADPNGTNSEEFARYGVTESRLLPEYHHLIAEGTLGADDLSLDQNGGLIVSAKIATLLKECFLPTCIFIEYAE
jgi:hypothetical protein